MAIDLNQGLTKAVRHFWRTRRRQGKRQGTTTGEKDRGTRSAVTGGRQMDGFVKLTSSLLADAGLPDHSIHFGKSPITLPGFFRPTKEWDIVVVVKDRLLAAMEFKSQVGSFGNNFNNRTEEAIGSATDLWTAYREGAFRQSPQPWLGYLMLVEEAPKSASPVNVQEPHFPVFSEFRGASYLKRYALLCRKLVRERLYGAACLLASTQIDGLHGKYSEPDPELAFSGFADSLCAHASSFAHSLRRD